MRLMNQRLTWAIAMMAGLVAQSANAQVLRTSYFGGPECAAPAECANGECANDECSNDDCSNSDDCSVLGDPWTLMGALGCRGKCLEEKGWFVKGFTAFGYQSDPDGAFAGNSNILDDREFNEFALHQGYLMFGRTASYADCRRLGFQVDTFYGWDGNEGQSFSNPAGTWDFLNGFDHGSYEWAIPQAYVDFAATEKLSVKAGHFYTIVGYEVIPATGNFFLSRQLTFYNSEPFTHTGILTTYVANDKWTFWNGWTLGMDTGFQQNAAGGNSYLGGFTWVINDTTTLISTSILGDLGARGTGGIGSTILTKTWGCEGKLQTVHQFDILETDLAGANFNVPTVAGVGGVAGDSIGFINYAFWTHGERLKSGVRAEWYKADGTSYYTLTGGVNVRPHANLVIRPEVRGMWAPGNNFATAPGNTSGFIGNLYNQTVFGVDAIVTF